MLGWLRRLLSARGAREIGSRGAGDAGRDNGAVRIDTDRIDAARERLREEIPPPAEPEADA